MGLGRQPGAKQLSKSGLAFSLQALLKTGEHSWSLAELIQALVLLTHCHSLASFVFGCGILPEGDPEGSPAPQAPSPPSEQSTPPSRDSLNHSGVSQGLESCWERKQWGGGGGPPCLQLLPYHTLGDLRKVFSFLLFF